MDVSTWEKATKTHFVTTQKLKAELSVSILYNLFKNTIPLNYSKSSVRFSFGRWPDIWDNETIRPRRWVPWRSERERWFSHCDTDKCDDQTLITFSAHTRPHQLFIVHLMNLLLFHSLLNFPKEALKAIARWLPAEEAFPGRFVDTDTLVETI